jgi:hypothetical protein
MFASEVHETFDDIKLPGRKSLLIVLRNVS